MINFITLLLIAICFTGVIGLFYFNDYFKKMAFLSLSNSATIILISFLARKHFLIDEILTLIVSGIILFSINILVGMGIIKKIHYLNEITK
jgi:hypothetical protein